ncbi:MAG TPA: hypothetical protein VMT44_06565 [Methanoregula sp.]|nr:hypothetical protein [Methanoregula sp.]
MSTIWRVLPASVATEKVMVGSRIAFSPVSIAMIAARGRYCGGISVSLLFTRIRRSFVRIASKGTDFTTMFCVASNTDSSLFSSG